MSELRAVTRQAGVVLASNPGPMTLDGTNTYVLSGSGNSFVIVDPGPARPEHLDRLASVGPVDLILITHRHDDHTEAAAEFADRVGAPVRAFEAAHCHRGGTPLVDGENVTVAGLSISVVHTPGHTSDSVCFLLPDDGPLGRPERPGSMLTGDMILGRGTTVILPPDGSIGAYLASMERLRAYGRLLVLPAHGPELPDLEAISQEYLDHRHLRLDQIRAALAGIDGASSKTAAELVGPVADVVYADVDPRVRFAAEASVRAQLEYLVE